MGSENCVEYLLKYDYININNQDKTNLMTALHLATAAANNSIVKKLLNKGIDINLKNK